MINNVVGRGSWYNRQQEAERGNDWSNPLVSRAEGRGHEDRWRMFGNYFQSTTRYVNEVFILTFCFLKKRKCLSFYQMQCRGRGLCLPKPWFAPLRPLPSMYDDIRKIFYSIIYFIYFFKIFYYQYRVALTLSSLLLWLPPRSSNWREQIPNNTWIPKTSSLNCYEFGLPFWNNYFSYPWFFFSNFPNKIKPFWGENINVINSTEVSSFVE